MRILLMLSLLSLAACSSTGTKLAEYPTREIDRPYTIPDGMKTWETWGAYSRYGSVGGYVTALPLIWQTPLSDWATVVWLPFPLGLRLQGLHTPKHTLGLTAYYLFFMGIGQLDYRFKFADQWALTASVSHTKMDIFLVEAQMTTGRLGFLFQVTDNWAVGASGARAQIQSRSKFVEELIDAVFQSKTDTTTTFQSSTASVQTVWSFARQWDFSLDLGVTRYDIETSPTSTLANFKLIHYWDRP